MEIRQLKSFVELYNCRSISKAAENLYISVSALSRRLQAMEAELQTELFLRDGSGLSPPRGAQVFYKEAEKILRQHDEAIIKMNKFKRNEGGILRVGVLDSSYMRPTMLAISRMQELYPDVELIFDCDGMTNVSHRFVERDIDVGITVLGEVAAFTHLTYEMLSGNTLAVMIGRNHPLWGKRPLHLSDLNGMLLYEINSKIDLHISCTEQFLRKQNIQFSGRVLCRSNEELMLYLATGKGIAFTGLIANEQTFSVREMVDVVPIDDTSLNEGFMVSVYDPENPLAVKFAELLKESW